MRKVNQLSYQSVRSGITRIRMAVCPEHIENNKHILLEMVAVPLEIFLRFYPLFRGSLADF